MDTPIQEFEFLDLENTNEKERNHLHQVLFSQAPGKSAEFPWLNNEETCSMKGWTSPTYVMNGPPEVVMPVGDQEIQELSPQYASQAPIAITHLPQAPAYAQNPESPNHVVVVPTPPTTSVPPPNACPAALYPATQMVTSLSNVSNVYVGSVTPNVNLHHYQTMPPPPGAYHHHHHHHNRHQSPLGSPHYPVEVDPNVQVEGTGSSSHRGSIGSQGSDRSRRGRGKGKRDDRHSIPSPESIAPVQQAYIHTPHPQFITYAPYAPYYPPHQPPPPAQSNVAAAQHATGTPLYLTPAPVQVYTTAPIYGAYTVPAPPPHHHHHHHQSPPEAQQELQPQPNEHFQQSDEQQPLGHDIVNHHMHQHYEQVDMHCQELPPERQIVSDVKNEPVYEGQVHSPPHQQLAEVEETECRVVSQSGPSVEVKVVNVDCSARTQPNQPPSNSECHAPKPVPLTTETAHLPPAAPPTQTVVPVVVRTVQSMVEQQNAAPLPVKEELVTPKAAPTVSATEGTVEPTSPRTSMSPPVTSPTFPAESDGNAPEIQTPSPAQPPVPETSRSWASLFKHSPTATPSSHLSSSVTSPSEGGGHQGHKSLARVGPFSSAPNDESGSSVPSVGKLPRSSPMIDDPVSYRLGEHLLQYDLEYTMTPLQPRGLTNRGNWCYVNATLQALLACPPFFNLLKSLPLSVGSNSSKSPTPITSAMVELVSEFECLPAATIGLFGKTPKREKLQRGRAGDDALGSSAALNTMHDVPFGPPFEPAYIYRMMNGIRGGDAFKVEGRQEDAEEFLGCLLNGLNDEMLELMKLVEDTSKAQGLTNGEVAPADQVSPVPEPEANDGNEWKVMGPKNKGSVTRHADFGRTPLSDIFRGQLRSRVQRLGDTATDNVQPFFTLQLDIEKAQSVKDAMELLVGRDQLEGLTSLKTQREVEAWQQVTLEELPPVLILHLKWFDYKMDGCSKIVKSVEFTVDLKVDGKLMSSNKTKYGVKQKHYKLFAVVYHDGNEATKGHYITDAYHQGLGGWIRYDDSSVRSVSEVAVLKPKAPRVPYLLYYRRADTIGRGASSASSANSSEKPR